MSDQLRTIQLVTGEILDLSQPGLGHPDGLRLWDRLSVGEGDLDRRRSSHDSPSARCLFPLCEGTGTGLVLVNPRHGRRYARHFKGEGGGTRRHDVALADQSPIVDWLCERYSRAGWGIETEHPFTVDGGGWEQRRISDYFVVGVAQPIAGEVQSRRTNHRQRAADARGAGYTSLWTPTKHGDSLSGVAQLRFTSTFDEARAERDPTSVEMAGFANLEWVDGGIKPELRRIPMGRVADELPGGAWAEFWVTPNQVLFVPPEQAARFAEHERRGLDDVRSGPADGLVRRHRAMLAQKAREQAAARQAERRAETERRERGQAAARRDPDVRRLAAFIRNGDRARIGGRLVWAARQVKDRPDAVDVLTPLIAAALESGMSERAASEALRTAGRIRQPIAPAPSGRMTAEAPQASTESGSRPPVDAPSPASFAAGPGSLAPCVACGVPTFRRRGTVPVHVEHERVAS